MEIRLKISIGTNSVEFEGTEAAYASVGSPIVERLLNAIDDRSNREPSPVVVTRPIGQENNSETRGGDGAATISMTVKAIANKFSVKSGTELLRAAAAKLAIVDRKETFSRAELLASMKSAIGFYKPSYNNNLSNYISTLEREQAFIEVGVDSYTLRATELSKLETALVEQ
jgi:hypothetical protein